MYRGGNIIGTAAMLSLAACGGEQGKLDIRPIGAPLAAGTKAVPFRIAEARGQFALGNIGLALEAFRLALREDPNSIDAITGVAACYDRMARFDLSRRNYEAALAIAPGDPQLLNAFATSLDLQGKAVEAASVRQEIKQRIAMATQSALPVPAPTAVLESLSPQPAALPSHPAVAQADSTKPVRELAAVQPTLPPPVVSSVAQKPVQTAEILPAPVAHPRVAPVQIVPAPMVPVQVAAPKLAASSPAIGRSVTIVLPPARPVVEATPVKPTEVAAVAGALPPTRPVVEAPPAKPAIESVVAVTLPTALPPVASPIPPAIESAMIIARAERDIAKHDIRAGAGPRLERLSLREVELITVPGPKWRTLTVGRTQRSATVRFVPLLQAAARPTGVRLLNAARVDRLAARTRSYLSGRGWRAISIGDAPQVRMRSVIFYPADKRRMAERLSAQFGFAIVQRRGARQVTILLGRDAARASALRARA